MGAIANFVFPVPPSRDYVNIKDFGAKGDGVTNDSSALTKALATGRDVIFPDTGASYNLGSTSFTINSGQFVYGQGMVTLKSTCATNLFNIVGYIEESGLANFVIDMDGAPFSSRAIYFRTDLGVIYRLRCYRMRFMNCYSGIDTDASNYAANIHLEDMEFIYSKGPPIRLRWTQGFTRLLNINIDDTWAWTGPYLVTWVACQIEKLAGVEMDRFHHTGQSAVRGGTAAFDANVGSFKIVGDVDPFKAFIWMNLVRSEGSCGFGIQIINVKFIEMVDTGAFTPIGIGMQILQCNFLSGVNISARGSKDQLVTIGGGHGIVFNGCLNITITNINVNICNGSGILVTNTSNLLLTNIQGGGNTRYCIEETGTSNNNSYTPTNFTLDGADYFGVPYVSLGYVLTVGAGSRWVPTPVGTEYANTWNGIQNFTQSLRINNTPVVGARVTGFGAMTGTATKGAIATYASPVISAAYVQAEVQAIADALQACMRRLKAYDDAFIAHGLIGP